MRPAENPEATALAQSLSDNPVQQEYIADLYGSIMKNMDDSYDFANAVAALRKLADHIHKDMTLTCKMKIQEVDSMIAKAMRDWEPTEREQDAIIDAFAIHKWDLEEWGILDDMPEHIQVVLDRAKDANNALLDLLQKYEHASKRLPSHESISPR